MWDGNCVDSAPVAGFRRETYGLCTNTQTAIAAQALTVVSGKVLTIASAVGYQIGDTIEVSSTTGTASDCAVTGTNGGTFYYVSAVDSASNPNTLTVTGTPA